MMVVCPGGSSRRKQSESIYTRVLKVELTGFTPGLDMEGGDGKEGTKNDSGHGTSMGPHGSATYRHMGRKSKVLFWMLG